MSAIQRKRFRRPAKTLGLFIASWALAVVARGMPALQNTPDAAQEAPPPEPANLTAIATSPGLTLISRDAAFLARLLKPAWERPAAAPSFGPSREEENTGDPKSTSGEEKTPGTSENRSGTEDAPAQILIHLPAQWPQQRGLLVAVCPAVNDRELASLNHNVILPLLRAWAGTAVEGDAAIATATGSTTFIAGGVKIACGLERCPDGWLIQDRTQPAGSRDGRAAPSSLRAEVNEAAAALGAPEARFLCAMDAEAIAGLQKRRMGFAPLPMWNRWQGGVDSLLCQQRADGWGLTLRFKDLPAWMQFFAPSGTNAIWTAAHAPSPAVTLAGRFALEQNPRALNDGLFLARTLGFQSQPPAGASRLALADTLTKQLTGRFLYYVFREAAGAELDGEVLALELADGPAFGRSLKEFCDHEGRPLTRTPFHDDWILTPPPSVLPASLMILDDSLYIAAVPQLLAETITAGRGGSGEHSPEDAGLARLPADSVLAMASQRMTFDALWAGDLPLALQRDADFGWPSESAIGVTRQGRSITFHVVSGRDPSGDQLTDALVHAMGRRILAYFMTDSHGRLERAMAAFLRYRDAHEGQYPESPEAAAGEMGLDSANLREPYPDGAGYLYRRPEGGRIAARLDKLPVLGETRTRGGLLLVGFADGHVGSYSGAAANSLLDRLNQPPRPPAEPRP